MLLPLILILVTKAGKIMKFAIVFLSLVCFALAEDLFVGRWKEDQSKRKNLNNYLSVRGKEKNLK